MNNKRRARAAVIDDQNGEEREREREDRKRIEESKEGGAIKQGIGRATVGFSGDAGNEMIDARG